MTESVVDLLEAIQVDHYQRTGLVGPECQPIVQSVLQLDAVEQPGEGVVARLVVEAIGLDLEGLDSGLAALGVER